MITLFSSAHFFNFVSFLLYLREVRRLKCAMLGAFTVHTNTFGSGTDIGAVCLEIYCKYIWKSLWYLT